MRCSMCGYQFDKTELTCHGGCPLAAHCMVICCPRCGYSTVDPARSGLSRKLLRLFKKADDQLAVSQTRSTGQHQDLTMRLLDLKPGQCGQIADVGESRTHSDSATLAHLGQYGLLPGMPLRLTQKRPVPIVQIGQTELALDHSVAAEIYVDLDPVDA